MTTQITKIVRPPDARAHIGDTNNPHKVTAAQAGAVSTTGDTMTGPLKLPDGSAAAPALPFADDTNTGIYRAGADILAFATGGAERFRVANAGPTVGTDRVWHAGNALCAGFYAYRSANQTLPKDATTKVGFNAEVFDHSSAFDTSTAKFVAPQGGVYLFSVNINTTYYSCNAPKAALYLYKNGVLISVLDRLYIDAAYVGFSLSGSAILLLDADDYVEVYVYWKENNSSLVLEGGSDKTSFAGIMLS